MNPFGDRIYEVIERLFQRNSIRHITSEFVTSALSCEVNAFILHLIADLLERARVEVSPERDMLMRKILPSLYYINENIYKDLKLEDIAGKSNLSSTYFHRIFKQLFQATPVNYMIERRMSAARQMLTTTDLSVRDIAWRAGYENEFYFSRIFKKHVGMSPSEFRRYNSILQS